MANKDVKRYSVYLGKQEDLLLNAVADATHVTPRQYIKGALLEMLRATVEMSREVEKAKNEQKESTEETNEASGREQQGDLGEQGTTTPDTDGGSDVVAGRDLSTTNEEKPTA